MNRTKNEKKKTAENWEDLLKKSREYLSDVNGGKKKGQGSVRLMKDRDGNPIKARCTYDYTYPDELQKHLRIEKSRRLCGGKIIKEKVKLNFYFTNMAEFRKEMERVEKEALHKRTVEMAGDRDRIDAWFEESLKEYLKQKREKSGNQNSSLKRDDLAMNNHILVYPQFECLRVQEIDTELCRKWLKWLKSDYKVRCPKNRGKKGLSVSSMQKAFDVLNGFFEWYYEDREGKNPLRKDMRPKETRKGVQEIADHHSKTLSDDDYEKIRQEVFKPRVKGGIGKQSSSRYDAVIWFLMHTGLRAGEVRGLKWKDIHLEAQYFVVERDIDDSYKGAAREGLTKNINSNRKVPLPKEAIDALMLFKKDSRYLSGEDFVFASEEGTPPTYGVISKALKRILQRTGIDEKFDEKDAKALHMLRHTHITRCVEAGMLAEQNAKIHGHDLETMYRVYYHQSEDEMKKLAEIQQKSA